MHMYVLIIIIIILPWQNECTALWVLSLFMVGEKLKSEIYFSFDHFCIDNQQYLIASTHQLKNSLSF